MPIAPSATTFAILGQLAQRPQSTYELATWMRRNLRFFWPRAESGIYEEPKRLVKLGFAKRTREFVGRRPRTVYTITPAGRRAFVKWLESDCDIPHLEFEGLVRVFLGLPGSSRAVRMNAASVRAFAEDIQAQGRIVAAEYLAGRAPFPDRVALSALTFDFLWHFADLLRDWADRSEKAVRRWPARPPRQASRWARDVFAVATPVTGAGIGRTSRRRSFNSR